ncbi:MAG TPA: SEC-C metal-binding domain-containing protein [Candidatus Ozemobacteraceae bacterium]|nr:SEC-C metal-binding domain-containing protein [Candidatus Ozemobacteraceae bacterium]HQG27106.1 SEC-C metal-binding domain-containing protein [Candidatus Ozemobacteraceae bacterium]
MANSKDLSSPVRRVDLDDFGPNLKAEAERILIAKHGLPVFDGDHLVDMYSLDYAGQSETCPKCRSPLQEYISEFIYTTNTGARVALSPGGYFCKACPTAVVDTELVRKACKPGLVFGGVAGLQNRRKELVLFRRMNDGHVVHCLNEDNTVLEKILTYDEAALRTNTANGLVKPRLSFMPDPDRQAMRLKIGSAEEFEYLVQYEVCDDPFCDCMILDVYPYLKRPGVEGGGVPYFRVDIEKQQLRDRDLFMRHCPDGVAIGDSFVERCSNADWKELRRYFLAEKWIQERECSPTDSRVELGFEYLDKHEGALVPYVLLFPFAQPFTFSLDGTEWGCFDGYTPAYASPIASLQWFTKDADADESADNPHDPDCMFLVNYRDQRILANSIEGDPDLARRLLGALRKEHPGVASELDRRRKLVTSLFDTWLTKNGREPLGSENSEQPTPADETVGRNEPCPCGSGKKFKKCCGRS